MKSYPSIIGFGDRDPIKLHTFDKIDGSNLRFEWSRKRGWYKFGTRRRLFNINDGIFGEAIPLFAESLAESLENIFAKNKWKRVIVFAEFWGVNSFAGIHLKEDIKYLNLIDVAPYKQGILEPEKFVDLFGEFCPKYFGNILWDEEFINRVKKSNIDITFEGVVGKTVIKNNIVMFKVKSQKWVDKVKERFARQKAMEIIDS